MDEQQMTPPQGYSDENSALWDAEADGLAYSEPEEPEEPETPEEDIDLIEPADPDTAEEADVRINDDGEVEFSDDFLGYEEEPKQSEKLARYTEDELKNIPFEQWDVERLDGNIKDYVPIVRDQMMRRQMQQQIAQRPETPAQMNVPKSYTPQELSSAARKLACEKLGLDDPDDFDLYEDEHQAALRLAMDELLQQRNTEIEQYQRVTRDYQSLQNFNANLVKQPDYMEFDQWLGKKMQEAKVTPQQVEAGFQEYLRKSGGNYRGVQGVIASWYKEFRQGRSNGAGRPKSQKPPVLEGTNGGNYTGRKQVNLERFGELDMDSQAETLMKMGLV